MIICFTPHDSFVLGHFYIDSVLVANAYIRHNVDKLSRIYPAGSRINSSNYSPVPLWNAGCQIGINVDKFGPVPFLFFCLHVVFSPQWPWTFRHLAKTWMWTKENLWLMERVDTSWNRPSWETEPQTSTRSPWPEANGWGIRYSMSWYILWKHTVALSCLYLYNILCCSITRLYQLNSSQKWITRNILLWIHWWKWRSMESLQMWLWKRPTFLKTMVYQSIFYCCTVFRSDQILYFYFNGFRRQY